MTVRNAAQFVGESIAKPVADEVGKMIETGVQSITGSQKPLNPEEEAKRKAEEQKKLQVAQANLNRIIESENRFRQSQTLAAQQKNQQVQEEAKENQVEQFEAEEKKNSMTKAQENAKRAVEAKPAQGAGG